MPKNFVIIKHLQDSGKYLFKVPREVNLHAGDKIVCNTARGTDQLGICCCDSFYADPDVMCPLFGTQTGNLRYVTGMVDYQRFENVMEDEEEA